MTPRLAGGPHSVLTFSRWNLSKQQTLQVMGLHSHPVCPNLPIKMWTRLLCGVGSSERGGVFPRQEATLQTLATQPLSSGSSVGSTCWGPSTRLITVGANPSDSVSVSAFLPEDMVGLGVSETSSCPGYSLRGAPMEPQLNPVYQACASP